MVGCYSKAVRMREDKPDVVLQIWDTAGQERFHALNFKYYRDVHAALLVYDLTDLESFAKVKKWAQELFRFASEGVVVALVGNKMDLHRVVKPAD